MARKNHLTRKEIVQLRERLTLPQSDFCQLLGVHPQTVSNWERGVAEPTGFQMALLAEFHNAMTRKNVDPQRIARRYRNEGPIRALRDLLVLAGGDDPRA